MGLTEQHAARVRAAAQGTPYVVTDAARGFDVRVDLDDRRWHDVLRQVRLRVQFEHRVRVDEARRTFSVTDVSRQVSWSAGAPGVGGSGTLRMGRQVSFMRRRSTAFDGSGRPPRVADLTFDSEEGRRLVVSTGEALGLRLVAGRAERAGLVTAVAVGVVLVVAAVVLGVLALTGVL